MSLSYVIETSNKKLNRGNQPPSVRITRLLAANMRYTPLKIGFCLILAILGSRIAVVSPIWTKPDRKRLKIFKKTPSTCIRRFYTPTGHCFPEITLKNDQKSTKFLNFENTSIGAVYEPDGLNTSNKQLFLGISTPSTWIKHPKKWKIENIRKNWLLFKTIDLPKYA